jgi:metallo-beta-lactamase family protein
MKISFLGATGTVTGSKYLLECASRRILIDCGLFQGFKQLRLRNWKPPPISPNDIDAVILTHAHIDHSGYLPLLVRQGFAGRVHCTRGTRDLLDILLPDSAHLQEEEARFANQHRYSKHHPALPLYTRQDAAAALGRLLVADYESDIDLGGGVSCRFTIAGHILGAAIIRLTAPDGRVVFSGDLGRPHDAIMPAPGIPAAADYLIVESTYGDRTHAPVDPEAELADAINAAANRGGIVIIPAFAVGRAQMLLHFIARLKQRQAIPNLPIFLNSPMATDVTRIYLAHGGEHRLSPGECAAMGAVATIVNSAEDSKALNMRTGPMLIISASGMATGGRVLHHLEAFASDRRNLILLAGFQAGGTRGASLLAGGKAIKIHGHMVEVRAEVRQLSSASAHADADELLAWMRSFKWQPKVSFVTHGEPAAADALRQRIERELGWECEVPDYMESVNLAASHPAMMTGQAV